MAWNNCGGNNSNNSNNSGTYGSGVSDATTSSGMNMSYRQGYAAGFKDGYETGFRDGFWTAGNCGRNFTSGPVMGASDSGCGCK